MKKIFLSLFVVIGFIFLLSSCEEIVIGETLTIELEGNILSWNAITSAKSYNIYIDNTSYARTIDNSYILDLDEGEYTLQVTTSLSSTTIYSNKLTYIVTSSSTDKIKLDTPIITREDDKIIITPVDNAVSYNIYDNAKLLTNTTLLEYTLPSTTGSHNVYVIALGDNITYRNSDYSNAISYTIKEATSASTVSIFEINDTHGAAVTNSDYDGMDKVASIITNLESKNDVVIKIANGDIFQGSYVSNQTRGQIFIDALNALDFDCFVIGNHEFDWGLDEISKYKDGDTSNGEANFPFLAINIIDNTTSSRPTWLDPYVVINQDGITIGIIGAIGSALTSSISADKVANYSFVDPVPLVETAAKELRTTYNCDLVIVATHEYESSTNTKYASLSGDSRIDGIICAHTHQYIEEYVTRSDGYSIPLIQSNTKNISVGSINYTLDNGEITSSTMQHYNPSNYQSSQEIINLLAKYDEIIEQGEQVIGYTSSDLSRSDLGVLACNSMADFLGCDYAFMNTGGVRDTISKGDIKIKDIYEVFPFDNLLIKFTATGKEFKQFLNKAGYLYTSSSLDTSSIVDTKTYTFVVIDYVFLGSSYNSILSKFNYEYTEYYIRDAVVYGIQNGQL